MPGTIRIQATSANPLTVNFTRQDGTAASCYSNYGLTTPVSLPATISADTSFYFPAPETFVISAKVDGSEIASASGTTVTQFLPEGRVLVFAPSVDAIERTALTKSTYAPQSGVGVPVVTSTTVAVDTLAVYGVRGDGSVYYDSSGASPGEAAVLAADPASGSGLSFVKIGV